jgi:oxalate decarboxylase/phosphoglucose isomerase-like protein (cupin superfamily)
MEETVANALPITILANDIAVDDSFLTITREKAFLTRHLKNYYLTTSSVYPKIVYKSFWIEEKMAGPLTKAALKIKVTTLYSDVIGIEFAKTKTIYSKCHARFLETLQGKGLLIMQEDTKTQLDEATAYVVELSVGQKAVIPPNWHYTLVNTGKETLATVELYKSEQELNQCSGSHKGTGIYVIERNGIPEIVKNSQYKNLSKYATVSAEQYALTNQLSTTESLYTQAALLAQLMPELATRNWPVHLNEHRIGSFPF